MSKGKQRLAPKYQPWIDARKRFRLSHAQVQMARELGLNPRKLGGMANDDQQSWKISLPEYIEDLYAERFGRDQPEHVQSIEQMVAARKLKKEERKARKAELQRQEKDGDEAKCPES